MVRSTAGATLPVLLLLMWRGASADATFDPQVEYQAGEQPWAVVITHVNDDEHLDLAVTNLPTNSVAILLGNGDGTFGAKTEFAAGGRPIPIATGDLNGDQRQDLVIGNTVFPWLSLLLGNGDGTFGPPITVGNSFGFVRGVALGDLNGDSRLDLLVPHGAPHGFSILLGNGDGTFKQPTSHSTTATPAGGAAIADLNGDAKQDVLIGHLGAVHVHLGNGDGTIGSLNHLDGPVESPDLPTNIVIDDVNMDGQPDVVASEGFKGVSLWLGKGDGTFGARADLETKHAVLSVAVGDFSGDGKSDLAAALTLVNLVSVWCGNGDGTFGSANEFEVGGGLRGVAVGELNGDGRLDLATANLAGTVSVLLNTTHIGLAKRTWSELKRAYR